MSDQNDSYSKSDEKHGVADTNRATLTDKEREAILDAALAYELDSDEEECAAIAATLRSLLARLA